MTKRRSGRAPPSDLALLIDAIDFAAFKHREQRRKGRPRVPCINRPVGLARVLAVKAGVTDVTTLAAPVLHDTIEDTKTSPVELERRFGKSIAGAVREVTDVKMQRQRMRKVLQVRQAPRLSDRAKLVKLADKICNLRDIGADTRSTTTARQCLSATTCTGEATAPARSSSTGCGSGLARKSMAASPAGACLLEFERGNWARSASR